MVMTSWWWWIMDDEVDVDEDVILFPNLHPILIISITIVPYSHHLHIICTLFSSFTHHLYPILIIYTTFAPYSHHFHHICTLFSSFPSQFQTLTGDSKDLRGSLKGDLDKILMRYELMGWAMLMGEKEKKEKEDDDVIHFSSYFHSSFQDPFSSTSPGSHSSCWPVRMWRLGWWDDEMMKCGWDDVIILNV